MSDDTTTIAARDEERIRTATLRDAAQDAVGLLIELGHQDHVVTRALDAAIDRADGRAPDTARAACDAVAKHATPGTVDGE